MHLSMTLHNLFCGGLHVLYMSHALITDFDNTAVHAPQLTTPKPVHALTLITLVHYIYMCMR